MRFVCSTNKKVIKCFTNTILKYKLHHASGSGIKQLIKTNGEIYCAGIVYDNGIPIGCAMTTKDKMYGANIGVYILPQYRKNGLATSLVNRVVNKTFNVESSFIITPSIYHLYNKLLSSNKNWKKQNGVL